MPTELDVAFPVLSDQELSALKIRGELRSVHAGETLYQEGDRTQSFFVVLDGAVEVVDNSGETPRRITVHRRGNFSGDVALLSGRTVLVTGRVIEDGTVVQLDPDDLRHAVDELPELGDVIIKAFIKRRALIMEDGFAGVQIIGSRFSPDAHRLRDFASRNAIPARFRDLETDPEAEAVLRSLGVSPSETPIVIGREGQ